jgi:hypothetical protein
MELVVCAGCRRHVRESDAHCPFCDARVVSTPSVPLGRMSRSEMIAAVAVLGAAAIAGCARGGGGAEVYGGPPPPPKPAPSTSASIEPPDAGK